MTKQAWVVGLYDNNFNMIKPLRYIVGTYERAEEVCEVLSHHNPRKIIMFDRADGSRICQNLCR